MALSHGLGACADGDEIPQAEAEETPRTEARDGLLLIPEAWGPPSWAPDDSMITYVMEDGQMWTSSPDGSNTEHLAGASWSSWSPDGSWISYLVDADYSSPYDQLWITSADRQENELVSSDIWSYEWSPDSNWIAYTVFREDNNSTPDDTENPPHLELWVWSTLTRDRERVSEGVEKWQWSPDGNHMSLLVDDGHTVPDDPDYGLWLWSASHRGPDKRQMVAHNVKSMWWSPDGDRIAYSVIDRESDLTSLWVSAGKAVQIALGNIWDVGWSPSGDQLAFLTNSNSTREEQWTREERWPPTGDLQVVTILGDVEPQAGGSYSLVGDIRDWEWSPNGNHIVYIVDDSDDKPREGYLTMWSLYVPYTVRIASDVYEGAWAWAPEGSRLAYKVDDGELDGSDRLPDDGDLWVWTADEGVQWLAADVGWMTWSDDGAHLAYRVPDGRKHWYRWHPGRKGFPLWIWSADKEVPKQLSHNVSSWWWSPDSSRIAYYVATVGDHGDIVQKGYDFGELWVWSIGEEDSNLVVNRTDRTEWEWSPSGNYLVYGNRMGVFIDDV